MIILFIVFKIFLFDKVRAHVAERQEYVQSQIDGAKSKNDEASESLEVATKKLSEAKVEASVIVADARVSGQKYYDTKISEAKNESSRLLRENREQIKMEKEALSDDIRREIVEVAFEAATKVVEREVKTEDNDKMINEFIDKVSE